jgi:hypothetical protein
MGTAWYCITSSIDREMAWDTGRGVLADTPSSPTSILSTSRGSNLVGDSAAVEPEREVPSDISGFDWKEEMEEEVSSVIEGMNGVLSWPGGWGGGAETVGEKESAAPLADTESMDL